MSGEFNGVLSRLKILHSAAQHGTAQTLKWHAGREDVSTDLAVCALLLGAPDAALVTLRLRRGGKPTPADPEVARIMADFDEGADGQVSGVCAFGEVWVKAVLGPGVKEYTWTQEFDLYKWAEQPAVRALLPRCT